MPVQHVLAGPNGSGKSSFVVDVLGPTTGLPVVNADIIAAARWPGGQAEHAYEAARIAASERQRLIEECRSFITETVFSHHREVGLVADAVSAGYLVHLSVIVVPVDLAVQRVLERVRRGGHLVPEDQIRARHERLWDHVAAAIRIADVTEVFDNSRARAPFRLCATYRHGLLSRAQWPGWAPAALRAV